MRREAAVTAVLVAVMLAGCAADGSGDGAGEPEAQRVEQEPASPAPPDGPTVVATVAPIADLVAQVAGERGRVTSLVPPGADSHTYEATPQDVADLEEADLYMGVGHGLNDGALQLAEATMPDDAPIVRLGEEIVSPEDAPENPGHDHDEEDGDHGHGPVNPHTWMHVPFAIAKVERIAELLAGVDPEGADVYAANAERYTAELAKLDEAIARAAETVPADNRKIVTFHDAYSYFADAYGFEFVGAVQPSDFSEPSAGEIAALVDQLRAEEVPAVFGSSVFPDSVTETIAAETGATYYGDLSDDVLPGEPGDPEHSYLGLMSHNARTIIDGLGGDAELIPEP